MNTSIEHVLFLANQALQYYIKSDICMKDIAYDEFYAPLRDCVCILQQMTNGTQIIDC